MKDVVVKLINAGAKVTEKYNDGQTPLMIAKQRKHTEIENYLTQLKTPSIVPTSMPISEPTTMSPTMPPTMPTSMPTPVPTSVPTPMPTSEPTPMPTSEPTTNGTLVESDAPTSSMPTFDDSISDAT